MGKLFGTDGIRGRANTYPITADVALQMGKSLAKIFCSEGKARAVIGRDTRFSGEMLETALACGMISMGMDVELLGVVPTPAVALLTQQLDAACGVMITASHNPAVDNGIKVFGPDGYKLSDEIENQVEAAILNADIYSTVQGTSAIGSISHFEDAAQAYSNFAKRTVDGCLFDGLKVVLDCAHGAAFEIAPKLFSDLGADVIVIGDNPDGHNINDNCGAMHPANLSDIVVVNKADVGICFDGDADRVIFLDSTGTVVNGDRLIGLCALEYKNDGKLSGDSVVVTSMSNLGLHRAMEKAGISVEVTGVGDRYVIERMREKGLKIGGEQSGHIIFLDYATTGDGIVTALHVLKTLAQKKTTLAELADFMTEFPQELVGINVNSKPAIEDVPALKKEIDACVEALGDAGRTVVRYSGTENKIRVLVEAEQQADVDRWVERLSNVIKQELC